MSKKIIVVIVGIALLSLVVVGSASNMTTYTAESVGTCSVKFIGNLTNMSGESYVDVYFQYGLNSGGFMFKTKDENLSGIGNFTESIKSPIFFGEKVYKYRAVGDFNGVIEYGDTVNFTMGVVDEIPEDNFSKYYERFDFSDLSVINFVIPILWVWTDAWGGFFWVLLFSPFLLIFISQRSAEIPALIGLGTAAGLFMYLPPEWRAVAQALLIITLAGIAIVIIKGRRW